MLACAGGLAQAVTLGRVGVPGVGEQPGPHLRAWLGPHADCDYRKRAVGCVGKRVGGTGANWRAFCTAACRLLIVSFWCATCSAKVMVRPRPARMPPSTRIANQPLRPGPGHRPPWPHRMCMSTQIHPATPPVAYARGLALPGPTGCLAARRSHGRLPRTPTRSTSPPGHGRRAASRLHASATPPAHQRWHPGSPCCSARRAGSTTGPRAPPGRPGGEAATTPRPRKNRHSRPGSPSVAVLTAAATSRPRSTPRPAGRVKLGCNPVQQLIDCGRVVSAGLRKNQAADLVSVHYSFPLIHYLACSVPGKGMTSTSTRPRGHIEVTEG